MVYPKGLIEPELISNENGVCVFKAIIKDEDGRTLATGHAYEKEGSSFINKTSYIENCETSAVGRALGMAGFGIDTSIRSFEEMENAELQQTEEKKINKTQEEALDKAIENRKIPEKTVTEVLSKYGYKSTVEIKLKDYMNIVNEFQKLVQK